jgi:hypothetical protein
VTNVYERLSPFSQCHLRQQFTLFRRLARGQGDSGEQNMGLIHVVFGFEITLLAVTMIAVTILHDWWIIKSTWAILNQHSIGRKGVKANSSA